MFSLKNRKYNTNKILEKSKEILYRLNPNNTFNGFIVLFIHWTLVIFSLYIIFFGEIDYKFYISVLIWIIIFIFHFYFNGCIFTRLERCLWNTKNWSGPWSLLIILLKKFTKIKPTNSLMNNVYICWGILLTIFIISKLLIL